MQGGRVSRADFLWCGFLRRCNIPRRERQTTVSKLRDLGYSVVAITFDDDLEQQIGDTFRCFGMDIRKGRNLLATGKHSEIETYSSLPSGSSGPDKFLVEGSIL
jgi:hypothetical protein